jgi:NAD(P)-dependent dehydrogenase (short-subunit alcohol dehydrogenase family)
MFDLTGKVAVVTGGTGVLGRVICQGLARSGASVAILARMTENTLTLTNEIKRAGGTAIGLYADVLEKVSLQEAATAVFRQIHPISWVSACATSSSPRGGTYLPRSVMSVSCKARMSRRIPKYSAFRSLAQERYSQNKSCSCCLCSSGSIGTIASLLLPSTAG